MFLYELVCSRCPRVRHYKTGIAIENFDIPKCICGGSHSLKVLSENADNEIEFEDDYAKMEYEATVMAQDYFALGQ